MLGDWNGSQSNNKFSAALLKEPSFYLMPTCSGLLLKTAREWKGGTNTQRDLIQQLKKNESRQGTLT